MNRLRLAARMLGFALVVGVLSAIAGAALLRALEALHVPPAAHGALLVVSFAVPALVLSAIASVLVEAPRVAGVAAGAVTAAIPIGVLSVLVATLASPDRRPQLFWPSVVLALTCILAGWAGQSFGLRLARRRREEPR